MTNKNIMVLGDVHGRWGMLNSLINVRMPEIILQCGDFGFFPNFDKLHPKMKISHIKPQDTKIYWCDGNHENHQALLENYNEPVNEIVKNVFYMKRGSVLELEDGRNVLFIGGADSIDKNQRTIGIDWFKEELITQEDIDRCLSINKKIDIVISHTCPTYFEMTGTLYNYGRTSDPSRNALDIIFDTFKPSEWFYGHWHQNKIGIYKNCRFTCLNMLPDSGCFRWL
ncbi:MAG: hypothetical protein EHM87_22370 [Burkholderiales bacterium]|nr:MAG: hypothetical protein EHM87_22370 [Burkholderiales bacterium]